MVSGSIQKVETNRFARADLEHRLLFVDDDMDLNALPKTNYIKSIVTSEAKMDLERKGIQSYQSQLYARFLCFGNGALSSLYDHSDGFYRRQLILTTKDKPQNRENDPFLMDKLYEELEGIFLWCLDGLNRLVQNDFRFTVSHRAEENVDSVRRSNNNILEFLDSTGYIQFSAEGEASSKEIYEAYKQWCDDNAYHCLSAGRVSAELNQNQERYHIESTNNIYLAGGKRVRGFLGMKVLPRSYL
jgi:putative DNA primase/helicase